MACMYFAGSESWAETLLELGVKHLLFSYYYFRNKLFKMNPRVRQLFYLLEAAKNKGYCFFLDSGAFTYQVKAGGKSAEHLPSPPDYFREYREFVREYGELFKIIAEFDVDAYVLDENGKPYAVQQIDQWTNELLTLPKIGSRVMPVYHLHRGKRWLRDWLIDMHSPYVGFASSAASGANAAALIANVHRFGKWIHGFAQTRIKTDAKYTPFNSIDSSTWLRSDKFGGTNIFMNGKFHVLDHLHKRDRAKFRSYYDRWGLDFRKILADDLYENRRANIIAWRELAKDMEHRESLSTREPYLCGYLRKHGRMPDRHPLLVRAAAAKAQEKQH